MSSEVKLGTLIDKPGKLTIDIPRLIETRALIQANSGGGKSYAIRKLLEETHGHVQQIVLDIEGEFATLREKYDYILAGKGHDVPATPQLAEVLARKSLELEASIIIDLYELKQHERIRFVKLFLDAMINAPRELWHPVMVVIDEAHLFAPEKGQSEAMQSVSDLATRGRKRGFAAVLATQRLSKLHKDIAAECLNKLIGRTGLDIDRKRAADELGFTTKEQNLSLRNLKPGEFYAFGPAISDEVLAFKVGEVTSRHPKLGQRGKVHAPVPTAKIRQVLAKLTDLPKEAETDLRDREQMRTRIRELERELRKKPEPGPKIDTAQIQALKQELAKTIGENRVLDKFQNRILAKIDELASFAKMKPEVASVGVTVHGSGKLIDWRPATPNALPPTARLHVVKDQDHETTNGSGQLNKTARLMLNLLINSDGQFLTRAQIAGWTHYSIRSSTFRNGMSQLRSRGLIQESGHSVKLAAGVKHDAIELLGEHYDPNTNPSIEGWLDKLKNKTAREMFKVLQDNAGSVLSKEQLADLTGYRLTSSTFRNGVSMLVARKLAERVDGGIRFNPELLGATA